MRLFLLAMVWSCSSVLLWAQQSDSSIAVLWANERQVNDPQPRCTQNEISIPFTMAGRLIVIEAMVDTTRGTFLLDTGAPFLVLNRSWFRQYGSTALVTAGGITGGVGEVMTTVVQKFELADISYSHVEADVVELSHIERSRGVPVFGLLGLNLFKSFELFIDYEARLIRLYKLDRKGNRLSERQPAKSTAVIPFYLYNNTILIDGSLHGVKMRYCLDTGAEVNVLHNRLPKKAMEKVQINSRALLTGTGSRSIEVLRGEASEIRLGPHRCPTMPVLVTHLGNMSRAYNLRIDGMLGYDFLSTAPISINFVTQNIILWEKEEQP